MERNHRSHGGQTHLEKSSTSKLLATVYPPTSIAEMKYFAYRLGYLSRTNIQREVCKNDPQLCRLIGHAALFDNVKNYLIQHFDDDAQEAEVSERVENKGDDDKDTSPFEHLDNVDNNDDGENMSTSLAYRLVNPNDQVSSRDVSQQNEALQIKVSITTIREDDDEDEARENDWDNDSDSSTEADDDDDGDDDDSDSADGWSDSTYENDDDDSAHPDRKIIDIFPEMETGSTIYKYKPRDDDLRLWSQQPRVFSQSQEQNLLIECFG